MATDHYNPSFSRGRKWRIGFSVVLQIIFVLALVVMANYLVVRHFPKRYFLSSNTSIQLSPRTLSFLGSLTNQVQVTLYYDKDEDLYNNIAELLKEYHSAAPNITVSTVDYYRDPGAAQELKVKYHLGSSTNKNLVIFDCEGRTKILNGEGLMEKKFEQIASDDPQGRPTYWKKPIAFYGEVMFTSALLAVSNPKPLQAYFLLGHGEHRLDDTSDEGYQGFGSTLERSYIQIAPLSLLGSNGVPADCNLLIIAGPIDPISPSELKAIEQYLDEGGRLFALFNFTSLRREIGLEKILEKWGVGIGKDIVREPKNNLLSSGLDVIVGHFTRHPVVNPLTGSAIQLVLPRSISRIGLSSPANDGLKVEEIAFSSPQSVLARTNSTAPPQAYPLIVAVEKSKAVASERGTTRILVTGDSLFLDNRQIESALNRDFTDYAVNWLLERNVLLQGLGPRPVAFYRLLVSKTQMQTLQWILLGALPGGILLFGSIVWLVRRR